MMLEAVEKRLDIFQVNGHVADQGHDALHQLGQHQPQQQRRQRRADEVDREDGQRPPAAAAARES